LHQPLPTFDEGLALRNEEVEVISLEQARDIAERWVRDWNSHDLDAILSHYADELEFTSPLVVERLGRADGTIRSKAELRSYFVIGLAPSSELAFELADVLPGVASVVLYYRNHRSRTVAETMFINAAGKVDKVAVHYR
jgi:SnoaL-like domain